MFTRLTACVSKKAAARAESPCRPRSPRRSKHLSSMDPQGTSGVKKVRQAESLNVGDDVQVKDSKRKGKIVGIDNDRWPIHVEFYDGCQPTSQWYQESLLRLISRTGRPQRRKQSATYKGMEASPYPQSDYSSSCSTSAGGSSIASETSSDVRERRHLPESCPEEILKDPLLKKGCEVIFRTPAGNFRDNHYYVAGDRGVVLGVDDFEKTVEVRIKKNGIQRWVSMSSVCVIPTDGAAQSAAGSGVHSFGLPSMQTRR